MDLANLNKKQLIALHVFYWVVFMIFFGFFNGIRNENLATGFIREISILPGRLLGVYFIIYGLIPWFLEKNKYVHFIGFTLLTLIIAGLLQRIFFHLIYYPLFVPNETASRLWDFYRIMDEIFSINTALILPLSFELFRRWYINQQKANKLAREKAEAELNFLKSQINPHFLFNTLNNIYGLSLKSSEQVPHIILKLSAILSTILYDCNVERISIEKEVKLISNYIDLESLRYGKRLDLNRRIRLENKNKEIAPMLLLPLIENAFKHGAGSQINNVWLDISLISNSKTLSLTIKNGINKQQKKTIQKYGIGIENVKKRLNLLYPDKHIAKFEEKNGIFITYLQIRF